MLATVEETDTKVAKLRDEIQTLLYYRNSIVLRLPGEVLAIIFVHAVLSASHTEHAERLGLTISHVCRLWRGVSLQTPGIWACVYSHARPPLTRALLERSKAAPICFLSSDDEADDETMDIVFHQSQRIKEIDFNLMQPKIHLTKLSSLNLPKLETLSLRLLETNPTYSARPYVSPHAPRLPLKSVSPLRHLQLRNIIFDLQVPYFTNLRTLDIRLTIFANESIKIGTHTMLIALEQMHHLESLELIGVLKPSELELSFARKIHLPYLTHVRLEVSRSECLTLFSHISCESIQSIVTQADWFTSPIALASIASEIYSVIPTIPGIPWNIDARISFSQSISNSTFGLDIFNTTPSNTSSQAPFRISFRGPPDFQALCSRLPTGCRLPSAFVYEPDYAQSDAEYCSIDVNRSKALFQSPSFAAVEHICVYRLRDLLSLLINPPPKPRPSLVDAAPAPSSSPVFFPSLKHVVCIELVPPHYRSRLLGEIASLEAILSARCIETLGIHLIGCNLKDRDVEALRKHVGVLEFSVEAEDM